MISDKIINMVIIFSFFIFIVISYFLQFNFGIEIFQNFLKISTDIIFIFPFVFIIIGLFESWVKRDTIEKYLGNDSGFMAYIWVLILGGCTFGPLIVALPFSYALYNKGVKISLIFTYLGAAAICRIPMTVFESSYLGLKFTLIRYSISIPLLIISSITLGNYLSNKNFKINKGN